MAKGNTTKNAGTRQRSLISPAMPAAFKELIPQLYSVEGFAKRYGEAMRGESYAPQTIYGNINEDNTELMFNGRLFPVLKIDKVRLIIWDGKTK